jgi:hypothetical protein
MWSQPQLERSSCPHPAVVNVGSSLCHMADPAVFDVIHMADAMSAHGYSAPYSMFGAYLRPCQMPRVLPVPIIGTEHRWCE